MTTFAVGAATDVGKVRSHNEDNFLVADTVFVVADGMGGHNGGEIASQIAVERLANAGAVGSIDDLVRRVQEANTDIVDRAREQPEFRGMGTTIVMLADIEQAAPNRLGWPTSATAGSTESPRPVFINTPRTTAWLRRLSAMVISPEPKPPCTRSATS